MVAGLEVPFDADTLGLIGSHLEMTDAQVTGVRIQLHERFMSRFTILRHGDHLGVDATVHNIFLSIGQNYTVAHPSTQEELRAFKGCDLVLDPMESHEADLSIVDNSHMLIAIIGDPASARRPGFWPAIRRARQEMIPIMYILPDGNAEMVRVADAKPRSRSRTAQTPDEDLDVERIA